MIDDKPTGPVIENLSYEDLELRVAALLTDDTLRHRLFEDAVYTDRHLATAVNRTCPKSTSLAAYSPELDDYAKKHAARLAGLSGFFINPDSARRRSGYFGPERLKPFGPSRYVP